MKLGTFMIGVAVVGIVFSAAQTFVGCGQQDHAEQGARRWASEMGLTVGGVSCVNADSDGDGYVSCTLNIKDKDGGSYRESVECATKFNWNTGCRVPKLPTLRSH